jgi:mannose-6-phosphate isomerase-like protein (cupin superfamily)
MTKDVVSAAPKSVKVLYENDTFRVLEMKYKKGQKLEMHSHPANLVYAVTPMKFKSTSRDGKTSTVRMKKGESTFSSEGSEHAIENLTAGVLVQIEMK